MISFKKINLNHPYYFLVISKVVIQICIKKISHRNADVVVYNIKYIMMESINNQNIDRENPLCLSFSDVDAYIIEESGNKHLTFALAKKNKRVLRNYKKLWNEIKK